MNMDFYEEVGECKVSRKRAKKNIEYPIIRFPSDYKFLVGQHVKIYRIAENSYLLTIVDKTSKTRKLHNPNPEKRENIAATQEEKLHANSQKPEGMRGLGFEPRNPYGTGPSSRRLWPSSTTPALGGL